ncbi:MAG TPA: TetR/AcrR family transcriptional regulator [Polyangiales bacterium]|jgi:AcrR family transcriptional regulator|nr:TetR/AcrR family transcriptional regulator [Polyangiales bacterium]
MATSKSEGSVRERLLASANELFYAEGVHTVGIDRVIAHAGVAKASLYSTFGSKDELVRAYLAGRHEARRQRISTRLARYDAPRKKILAIFDALAEHLAEPTFRGCAFINASAEGPRDGVARSVCDASRAWVRDLFTELSRELGASDAAQLGRQLTLLYDGATIGASMDRTTSSVSEARALARTLIDLHSTAMTKTRRTSKPKRRAK